MIKNVILSKFKNIKKIKNLYIINFQNFYFLKIEKMKSNQTYFQNLNLLKIKTIFKNKNKK